MSICAMYACGMYTLSIPHLWYTKSFIKGKRKKKLHSGKNERNRLMIHIHEILFELIVIYGSVQSNFTDLNPI